MDWRAPGEGAYRDEPRRASDMRPQRDPWDDPRAWAQPRDINLGRIQVTRPERPSSVSYAVGLMYVGAGFTILSTIIYFATRGQLADSLVEANPTVSRAAVDRAVDRLGGREIGRTVVGVALWIWMAVKNGQGRRWARVVATILGVLNLISILLTFAFVASAAGSDSGEADLLDYTLPYLVLAAAGGVLAVVILVQLFRPDSSRYIDETSRWDAAMTLRGY